MYEEYKGHDIAAYAGYVTDDKELLECASGGIATALSREMIRRGGYVAGVAYNDDFTKAQYKIASQESMLEEFKGSKYVEVEKGTIYRDLKALLDAEESVLFFGLPCTVAAMRAFLHRDYENLIMVDLICHGPTLSSVHQQYLRYLEKNEHGKVKEFSTRKKKDSWTPPYLYAKFDNGRIFEKEFYKTEYGCAFSKMSRKSCYTCKFRGNHRTGDIMIGDFWGAAETDEFWNKNGISSILVHTDKGNAFLQSTGGIRLYPTTFDRIVEKNPHIIFQRSLDASTVRFAALFASHGLIYAAHHSECTGIARYIPTPLKVWIKDALLKKSGHGRHS